MTSYNTYPNLPSSASPPENPQVGSADHQAGPEGQQGPSRAYHLNVVQAKKQGLIAKEQMFKKKYEKYTKILN